MKGDKKDSSNSSKALQDVDPPKDPQSKADEAEAVDKVKKAIKKMQDKHLEMQHVIQAIGKRPGTMAASVKQEAKEISTKLAAHLRLLGKYAITPLQKVNVDDFKSAVAVAYQHTSKATNVKACSKPHVVSEKPKHDADADVASLSSKASRSKKSR